MNDRELAQVTFAMRIFDHDTNFSPQYIQYLPSILAITCLLPEEQLREAAKLSVCKINIDSDLRLAMTGTIRQFMEGKV